MAESTITTKGQVTIPKEVRDALGLVAGDRISFLSTEQGFLIVPAKGDVHELRGLFRGRRKKPLTVEEMNALVAKVGARR